MAFRTLRILIVCCIVFATEAHSRQKQHHNSTKLSYLFLRPKYLIDRTLRSGGPYDKDQPIPVCIGDRLRIFCDTSHIVPEGERQRTCSLWHNSETELASALVGNNAISVFDLDEQQSSMTPLAYSCKVDIIYSHKLTVELVSNLTRIRYYNCTTDETYSLKKAMGKSVTFQADDVQLDSRNFFQWMYYGNRISFEDNAERKDQTESCDLCLEYFNVGHCRTGTSCDQLSIQKQNLDEEQCKKRCQKRFYDDRRDPAYGFTISNVNETHAGYYDFWKLKVNGTTTTTHNEGEESVETETIFDNEASRIRYDLQIIQPWFESKTTNNWLRIENVTATKFAISWRRRYLNKNRFGFDHQTVLEDSFAVRLSEFNETFPNNRRIISERTIHSVPAENTYAITEFSDLKPLTFYLLDLLFIRTTIIGGRVRRMIFTSNSTDGFEPFTVYARINKIATLPCGTDLTELITKNNELKVKWIPSGGNPTDHESPRKFNPRSGLYVIEPFSSLDVGVYRCRISYGTGYFFEIPIKLELAKSTNTPQPPKPENFRCFNRTETSISLEWQIDNGNIIENKKHFEFIIIYTETNKYNGRRKWVHINSGSTRTINIENLKPETLYSIEIATADNDGDSESTVRNCATATYWDHPIMYI